MQKNCMGGQLRLLSQDPDAVHRCCIPALAKSCRSNTAARIFQLNKTDNLKTIIKII